MFKVWLLVAAVLFGFGQPPSTAFANDREPQSDKPIRVLFLGDSLTAGYGVGAPKAFPARVQELAASNGRPIEIVNAGVSGDTSAGGVRRISHYLDRDFDILVLALGANDALRGLNPTALEQNLRVIMERFLGHFPAGRVLLTGMRAPPNFGKDYGDSISAVYQKLATVDERISYMPFLLEGVAGDPAMNLEDRIHPSESGHVAIAAKVWERLQPMLPERPI